MVVELEIKALVPILGNKLVVTGLGPDVRSQPQFCSVGAVRVGLERRDEWEQGLGARPAMALLA